MVNNVNEKLMKAVP